ncbi:MAG TPA: UDP-N-acetylmuramoyl-L-alanine--D-glutamate ligase [Candidatus Babeliales bacterium]|nr:UDP-N-acetylmuramoyl-L-alanine--D-glutamate ligase [Candidatus Babeliales bacterium]
MIIAPNKRIGIWGFGVVGKAATRYFLEQGYHVNIMDKRKPTADEELYLKQNNIQWYDQEEQETFFYSHDHIIPSPGINIDHMRYATYQDKWLPELDFFHNTFHKPIIAITGSIGKTSTTYLLGQLYKALNIPVTVGGNIGIATFSLISEQKNVDCAIIEVSSFQLNYCTTFAPTLAIWTNFYPNHLDHHATETEYFLAKQNILAYQKNNHIALVPFALRNQLLSIDHQKRCYFNATLPHINQLDALNHNEHLYYIKDGMVMHYNNKTHTFLLSLTPTLCNLSFIENILILAAACDILALPHNALHDVAATALLPAHRMEKIGSINSIHFYNDSKATTTASTFAAVTKLNNHPLHLFLGGLSKGVDRAPFIAQLKSYVKHIYCFGKEADALHAMCTTHVIPSSSHVSLDSAVHECLIKLQPHDYVLLSPAGSSYDLYENYEKRGEHFKKLIMHYIKNHSSP